ncbi:hypothetical protein [Clostridium sp. BJN0013]|uniref:hypothetical protein n=1 Tax=Clostridium sp. BJN0013 TaxID=3236840 RepID=UPI0034C652DF
MDYITLEELKDIVANDHMVLKSDTALKLLIDTGKEIIDNYCGKEFTEPIPSTVKVVNAEIVNVLLNDSSKESESNGDYSYKVNSKAYEQILKKLDGFFGNPEPISKSNSIRCQVI